MPNPRSLWADPAAREPHRGWFERSAAPPPPAPPGEEPPRPQRSRWLIAAVITLALACAGLIGAALAGSDAKPKRAALPPTTALTPARIASLATTLAPGVVRIRSGKRTATGFVLDTTGTILTTASVVAGTGTGNVSVVFDDTAQPVAATVLGTDTTSGVAALSIDPAAAPAFRTLQLGNSAAVRAGEPVLAIGYRPGLDRSVAAGIISSTGAPTAATAPASNPQTTPADLIFQTDAVNDPGGPIVNRSGLVIALSTAQAASGTHGTASIGLAIPANTLRRILPQLKAGQSTATPSPATGTGAYLGVSTTTAPGGRGALVQDVIPGGPADRAGIEGVSSTGAGGGDTITAVDARRVHSAGAVVAIISSLKPGQVVSVQLLRSGHRFSVDVTLGTRPVSGP